MDTMKEKKLLHRAYIVVSLLLAVMIGAVLEVCGAARGTVLAHVSGVIAALAFVGATGFCAHTFTELEKLG